jgi:hypothetical protein
MTVASDSMKYFKGTIGQEFKSYFPVLPLEIDDFIRNSYKGGWTYLNPKYANMRIKGGVVFDVNSLYPSRMYDCILPFGEPVYYEGQYQESRFYPCYIQRIRVDFDIKENHLPTIQLKNNPSYVATEYLSSSNGNIEELTLTNIDLDLFFEHYNINYIEYVDGYKFRGCTGMFKKYIDYWAHIKETTTGAMRTLAKLMLNSLYGKFASNPRKQCKIPLLNPNDYVSYTLDEEEITEPVFTAVASFITAHARYKTITSAQAVYDRFIYADTDSLHLIGTEIPENLQIHETKLGYWKHESTFEDSLFVRAKTYIEMVEGHMDVKCAGMPENVKKQVTFDNFHSGSTFHGKLVPKSVSGGVVLVESDFTIK